MANRVPASSGRLECMQMSWTGWRKTSRQIHVSPGRLGRQVRVLTLHDSTQVVRSGLPTYKRCKTLKCKTVHHEKRLAFAQIMYARLLSGTGKTRVRQKVQPLRLDKIVLSDEKMFRFGESGLSAQNYSVHTKVTRKRDLKPSMVAPEGDKFMKGIMVAAGATLDGRVWEPHFVPSTVTMAPLEYHGLLAHYYIPKATAQIGMDFVMQEDGAPSHSSAMTRNWRSDAANWPPTATLFTPEFPANSPDLNPFDNHVWAAWQNEVNKVPKERFAGQAKNEMEMKAARCLHRLDPGGLKRGEQEHRELAQATPLVHGERGRLLRVRPREARVVD